MTDTHTPGPWSRSNDAVPDLYVQVTIYDEAGERVATAFQLDGNANLIAAAPDLLEALIEVTAATWDYLNGSGPAAGPRMEQAAINADDAIKKASRT